VHALIAWDPVTTAIGVCTAFIGVCAAQVKVQSARIVDSVGGPCVQPTLDSVVYSLDRVVQRRSNLGYSV
jgi:hypothetical protein